VVKKKKSKKSCPTCSVGVFGVGKGKITGKQAALGSVAVFGIIAILLVVLTTGGDAKHITESPIPTYTLFRTSSFDHQPTIAYTLGPHTQLLGVPSTYIGSDCVPSHTTLRFFDFETRVQTAHPQPGRIYEVTNPKGEEACKLHFYDGKETFEQEATAGRNLLITTNGLRLPIYVSTHSMGTQYQPPEIPRTGAKIPYLSEAKYFIKAKDGNNGDVFCGLSSNILTIWNSVIQQWDTTTLGEHLLYPPGTPFYLDFEARCPVVRV
jgi:hypothetical protein